VFNYILVAVGAAAGGVLRYWLSDVAHRIYQTTFPIGTLTVNVIGSFLVGIFIYYFDSNELISSAMKVLLTIGFCGGFTTFSSFSYETLELFRNSEYLLGIGNILLNVLLTIAALVLAIIIARALPRG
jgi:fluoride exporter